MTRRLLCLAALGVLLGETMSLTPYVRAQDGDNNAAVVDGERQYPTGRVVETAPAPITIPASGGTNGPDPTIGGEPMFVPYTPPDKSTEIAGERTAQSRTLENPDGTFTLEMSDGPINYADAEGNWHPIDLALVAHPDGGYRVAATAGSILVDTTAGELGVIELDGHRVALSLPGFASDGLGTDLVGIELDQNTVNFSDALGTAADVWVRPVDIGLEFGATWPDPTKSTVVSFVLDPGDLIPTVGEDGQSIVFSDEEGEFAGAISQPIVREGSEDGPPLHDLVSVALVKLGQGGHLLSYSLDPLWLSAPDRVFPVILDPVWCMGKGASGCDENYTGSNNYDTFVYSASPNSYESGWTVLRTGYDVRSDDGGTYGTMRTLLQFGHPTLPDGAVIYDTDLQTKLCCIYGNGQGQTVYARRVTKWWQPPFTWNQFNSAATTTGEAAATVPASGYMNWDVDAIVQSWYTRTNGNRTSDFGIALRMANEGSAYGEVNFRRYNYGTSADRPLLRIWFTQPKVGIDFDSRLGAAYAPSSMVAGVPVKLAIKVENKMGSAHPLDKCTEADTNCWKVGFRWFDEKGNAVAVPGGTQTTFDLLADVAVGSSSAVFPITITPPATVGQYTLRLDLVHYYYGTNGWASDYATAAAFYSRNKKLLTSSSTRWTGSSAIERSEFSINVGWGVGGGQVQTVPVGSGGALGIDLSSRNLSLHADTGLGFSDRIPMSLTYGYNEALAEACSGYLGVLGACGWYTNWDERVSGGSNQTGFDYTYYGPDGTPYMLDTSASGQLVGGAPVLVNRPRITVIDENGGWDGTDGDTLPDIQAVLASGEGTPGTAFAGAYIGKAPANATKSFNLPDKVNLSTYRKARFAIRTTASTGATSSGLCFYIHNLSDAANFPDKWFCYTVGAAWNTGQEEVDLGFQPGQSTLRGTWNYLYGDVYEHVRNNGAFGGPRDDYQVTKIHLESSSGSNSGSVYIDGFRFEALDTVLLDDANVSWTSGSATVNASDYVVNTASIQTTPASSISPRCLATDGCFDSSNPGLWAYAYADWYWKKSGGTSAAMVFYVHNTRSGGPCYSSDCTLLYYAGAAPNVTASATLRISGTMPTTWTLVRRNVLEDARQALGLYDDAKGGAADELVLKGFAPLAVDGVRLLVDRLAYGNLADASGIDPTGPDANGALGQQYHPGSVGSTTFTYDFSADYPDGSRHYFNRDGLLLRIRDRDRQTITLDWSFDAATAGPTAYSLTAIHAPTDGSSSGGTTFERQFTITRGDDGSLDNIRFDEDLGRVGDDSSQRAVIFVVEDDAAPDLLKVSPARKQPAVGIGANGAFCGARPNGCTEYAYTDTTNHRLQFLADPRWDGSTTGSADYRLEVGRSGTDPMSIKDRSHASATLLNVLAYSDTRDQTLRYTRALWQDAAAAATNAARATDLTPDGKTLTAYVPRACTGDCGSSENWPEPASQANYKAADHEFDGLARVTTVKTYRCPIATDAVGGCTAGERVTMTRSETNAAAKIDNYADPLAGGRLAWRADADQVFASLKDSGGTNADWYRTEYVYDGAGLIAETIEVRQVEASNHLDTIKFDAPHGFWRLNETTGSTMADSSGNSRNGTYSVAPTLGGTGAVLRDAANKAPTFNGTSQYGKVPNATIGQISGSFTVEGWLKSSSSAADQVWLSTRGTGDFTFDAMLATAAFAGGKGIRVNVGNGTAWLLSTTIPFDWSTARWYHVAVVVDDAKDRATVYVDGQPIGGAAFTTAGGPVLTISGRDLFIGQTGLGAAPRWFAGQIDEVALFTAALGPWDIAAHFRAGRAVATVDSTVIRDTAGRPVETATAFLVNGGFEQDANGWALGASASISNTEKNTGVRSLQASDNPSTQVSQLVPGQTFRLQFATKSSVATALVHAKLEYWQLDGTPGWATMTGGVDTNYTNTSWSGHAYDITLPMDTDGRVKLTFTETGTGSGWIDDVLVVTAWGTIAYNQTPGIGLGLPTDRYGLASCATGPCSTGFTRTQLLYAATTSNPTYHPAIFPTTTIANWIDGTQGPGTAEDVTALNGYDSWGRTLVRTDPDGVTDTTVYGSGNQTDLSQTKDGLNNPTSMTYDAVGNALGTTTPLGRVTSHTFDALNHALTTTGPDGVVSRTNYDNYGRVSASFANYFNGAVESTDGDATDDLMTVPTYDAFGHATKQEADCGAVGACTSNGGLAATATTTYDLLDNTVAATTWPGTGGSGTARMTTSHFETYDPPAGTMLGSDGVFSRTAASGVQLPLAPTGTPAPLCPGSATVRCNTVSTLDASGRAILTTDAYGVVTRTRYDLDGRVVEVTANYVDGIAGAATDEDLISLTQYDLAGNPAVSWDSVNRRDERLYDRLGRLLRVEHLDSNGVEHARETTEYLPSGRVDWMFDGAAYTKTVYDGAGRAIRTIANWDNTGNAGMTLDALESTVGSWQIGPSVFFIGAAAAAKTDDTDPVTLATAGNAYHPMAPVSGRGRLRVTTHATNTNTGFWLDLSGPTYQSGHTYKASFDLAASASGLSLTAYLGQDGSGGSFGSSTISSNLAWTRYTVTWTVGASLSTPVRFAIRKASAGTSDIYLDNLVVWDSTIDAQQKDWSQTGIVSSVSAYNADGEVTASILPPGDPATERPLVTTVAFDAAGRPVSSVTNGASGAYAAIIAGTVSLAAYFPLDERFGTSTADKKSGGGALTVPATATLGLAGGIDEARTAARVTAASGGYLSRSTNATGSTTNVSMEAWIRSDTTPAGTVVVASNGASSNSWGIAIDSAGNAAGFTQNSGGAGFTTMASTKIVTDGAWHHLVLTRGASTWALAVDGVAKTLSNNTTSPGTPGAGFTAGALSDGTRAFAGEIDEVAVYTADIAGSSSAHWAAGRKTDEVTALTTRNAYDRLGRLTDAWAPDLVRTKAGFDRLGNQVETVANYRDGVTTGGTGDDDVRSTFAYNVLGELIGYCPAEEVKVGGCDPATPSEVQAWHYEFDKLGRQIKTIPPDNTAVTDLTTEEIVYEAGGRIAKTCRYPALVLPAVGACGDPNSRHVDFTYDDLGRITEQKTWDRAGGSDTLKFTKTLTWNKDGSPATVNEGSDTLTNVYDDAGRLSELKRGSTVLTAYTYTPGTNTIATRADGSQGPTAFTYDWARRQTIIDPDNSFVAGTVTRSYRLDGLLASQSFPSSLTETLAYDAAKRPLSISLGAAGSISQTFDRAGNITSDARSLTGISGDAGSGTQAFTYDNLSRLTGSSLASNSRSYQYDLDGNRTRRTEGGVTTDFTYDRADQLQSQTIGGTVRSYDYDRYGNLLQSADPASATTTYAYDEANRLKTINPPGGGATQITFTLDALDRHATRAVGGATTDTYAYLDTTETAWQTGQATTTTSLLDADGTRLAVKTGTTVSWLVFDLHGSVVALCPSTGSTLSDAYRFDGWGQQIASAGTASNPWRYRGLLNVGSDALTGALLDMVARHYSPQLGVFTQQDSVQGAAANPATMNRFLYALANPATLIDPDGHRACMVTGTNCVTSPELDDYVATRRATSSRSDAPGAGAPEGPVPGFTDLDAWVHIGFAGLQFLAKSWSPPCDARYLTCTVEQMNQMTAAERLRWMKDVQRIYGTDGWLNALEGFIEFAADKGVMRSDTFVGQVDASILTGIQDGLAMRFGHVRDDPAGGSGEWLAFFDKLYGGQASESDLIVAGVNAEQAGVRGGIRWATAQPTSEERVMLGGADWWRSISRGAIKDQYGIGPGGLFSPRSRGFAELARHYSGVVSVLAFSVEVGDGWNSFWDFLP